MVKKFLLCSLLSSTITIAMAEPSWLTQLDGKQATSTKTAPKTRATEGYLSRMEKIKQNQQKSATTRKTEQQAQLQAQAAAKAAEAEKIQKDRSKKTKSDKEQNARSTSPSNPAPAVKQTAPIVGETVEETPAKNDSGSTVYAAPETTDAATAPFSEPNQPKRKNNLKPAPNKSAGSSWNIQY